ncbi:MAG: hypothetical protein ACYC0N_03010 [Carboxydocellales bacterium]
MIKDLKSKRFGKLTVIQFSHVDDKKQSHWFCLCDCNKDKIITKKGKYLTAGDTKSCGCLREENLEKIRGKSNYRPTKEEYSKPYYKQLRNVWRNLIHRCHNPKYKGYKNYGGRGIYVCDEWRKDFWNFYNWSIANGYQVGFSLDRLVIEKNYNPDNCEWISTKISCGFTKNITQITIRGTTKTAKAWENDAECEVTASTILDRYKKGVRGTKLLKKRTGMKHKIIEIKGQIMTIEEWSELMNIKVNTIISRWRRGKRGKELIEAC